jgi:hypothetical protein
MRQRKGEPKQRNYEREKTIKKSKEDILMKRRQRD